MRVPGPHEPSVVLASVSLETSSVWIAPAASGFTLVTVRQQPSWAMDAPSATSPGGTNQHPLIQRAGDERYPSMSPDGTKLVRERAEGTTADAAAVGRALGERILARGGRTVLDLLTLIPK